jgi:SAM-dependent methyltransferase
MRGSFNTAAHTYDAASTIQDLCFDTLVKELQDLKPPTRILDIGCGTGKHTVALAQQFPNSAILAIDQSEAMITYAKKHHAHPNITYIAKPFHIDECTDADLIFSNASFQWFDTVTQSLLDLRELPHSPTIAISFFVKNTYKELSHLLPDKDIPAQHFLDPLEISLALGASWTRFKGESHLLFPSLKALFLHMRHTGVKPTKATPMTPSRFRNIDQHFLSQYGQYTLTYDALFCLSLPRS